MMIMLKKEKNIFLICSNHEQCTQPQATTEKKVYIYAT